MVFLASHAESVYAFEYADNDVYLENDNIIVIQSERDDAYGRFSLLAKLAEKRTAHLLFGSLNPWTSYTSLSIDGQHYVFGGSTGRRAGLGAPTGSIVDSGYDEGGNLFVTVAFGDVWVTQRLGIVRGLTTGRDDALLIQYSIENRGQRFHRVGLRLMLDTMLGSDDGATLRFGGRDINTDQVVNGQDLPSYWQAFGSLDEDEVVSEGVLRGPGLTPPDKVVMSNWGNFADHVWEPVIVPGREFIREGAFEMDELDSAVGLYWMPRILPPGERFVYATMYGLGAMDGRPGDISIGLTSPTNVDHGEIFYATAYVEGTLGNARNVVVRLETSDAMLLADDAEREIHIDELGYGEVKQVAWPLVAVGNGDIEELRLVVSSEGNEDISVSRQVSVHTHTLKVELSVPERVPLLRGQVQPFVAEVSVHNAGTAPAMYPVLTFSVEGGEISRYMQPMRHLGVVKPQETVKASWVVVPDEQADVRVVAEVRTERSYAVAEAVVDESPWISGVNLELVRMAKSPWNRALFFVYNLPPFWEALIDISYYGDLEIVHVSRGELSVDDQRLNGSYSYTVDERTRRVQVVVRGEGMVSGTGPLLALNMVGEGRIQVDRFQLYSGKGQLAQFPFSVRELVVANSSH